MKKILALSTIRSDYDLMSGLYRRLHDDPSIDLRLLVAGAHLSRTYGHSVEQIEADGFNILARIETLIDSDSPQSRLKTASLLLQNSIDLVAAFSPDLIMYAGDREDVLIGAMLGTYLSIPTMHFFGGDHEKDGHADTAVRHATSKLSSIHMVATEEHKQRLIRMGESSRRIFTTGSIALDKFVSFTPFSREEIYHRLSLNGWSSPFALVIFHPVLEELNQCGHFFENILMALKEAGIPAFVSYPNTDPGNKQIISVIERYRTDNSFHFFKNLPRDIFLSIYKGSAFIIGNSSSGILEAASIPIPAINVGMRQRGRYAAGNVIFCDTDPLEIRDAVRRVTSEELNAQVAGMVNPYGDGNSCERAFTIIKQMNFSQYRQKLEDPLDVK
jgi:UDP-N-acetylglucosamine 2-epimerase (non-hydrolysing)/GDP/UDP-N,N'-diacetylbacillosamine 2-epimerase (hydrolysing)